MENPIAFVLAVLTLLAVPGPTNTLLLTGGATAGFRRSLPLLLGELAGYLISIFTLRHTVGVLFGDSRTVAGFLRILVAAYLVFLSIQLWRVASMKRDTSVTVRRVFVTTLLNPKALVFGLFLIPAQPVDPALYYAAFCVMATSVGTVWIGMGHLAKHVAGDRYAGFAPKIASVTLALFATYVAMGTFR